MPVPVTDPQLQQLLALVQTIVTDKATADQATADSNTAHAVLQTAQADVANKDASEAMADGVVNVDIANLQAFVASLGVPPA